jgi:hypothetical protein
MLYHLSKLNFRTVGIFYLRAFVFALANSLSLLHAPDFGPRQNTLHISKPYF